MKKKAPEREETLGRKKGEAAVEAAETIGGANRGHTTSVWDGLWAADAHLPRVRVWACVRATQAVRRLSRKQGPSMWNREARHTRPTNEDSAVLKRGVGGD